MRSAFRFLFLLTLTTAACSSSDDGASTDTRDVTSSGGAPSTPGEGDGWEELITGEWTMPPGEEDYVCVRYTLTEDLLASAFEAINPPGTHHTLLTVGEPDGPDGITPCDASVNKEFSVYGSGVGTNPMVFPEGVAVRLEAGQQLLLNLHLYNTDSETLSETSGTRFRRIDEVDLVDEAEGVLASAFNLDIPPNTETVHTGTCTIRHDISLFAVSPHMHQLGTYARVTADTASAGEVVLRDGPYDFDEQIYYMIDPLPMAPGDAIHIECTHVNDTDAAVSFGDSSDAEMCISGLYWYPAYDSPVICFQ